MNTKSDNLIPLRQAVDTVTVPEIGRVAAISESGVPHVECKGSGPFPARVFATLDPATLRAGAEVFLFFAGGDPGSPVIAGVLAPRQRPTLQSAETTGPASLPDFAHVDGKRIAISGRDEIVLTCGEASITLRRNGKIVIRGTAVESHSLGSQWVTGAAVKIN